MIIEIYQIEDVTETREYTKLQLCPLMGWPGGVDPYPDSQWNDVVMVVRDIEHLRARGKIISQKPLELHQKVILTFLGFDKEFVITKMKTCVQHGQALVIDFIADYYAPIKTEVSALVWGN